MLVHTTMFVQEVIFVHESMFVHEIVLMHEVRSMPQQVATALVQPETVVEFALLPATREAAPMAKAMANIGIRFFIKRIINVNCDHTVV